jgi:hypothetical protein
MRLTDSNVRAGSTVTVSLRLLGGVSHEAAAREQSKNLATFCGFEKEVVRAWSKGAPDWRHTSPGLCLEGKCGNVECKAVKKWVIMNWGCNDFDLLFDGNDPRLVCPICSERVRPTACAFNRCLWKYSGMKADKDEQVSSVWRRAKDQYHTFSPTYGDTQCKWKRLLIQVKPGDNAAAAGAVCTISSDCPICLESLDQAQRARVDPCAHDFHKNCIRDWLERNSICPVCVRPCIERAL